MTRADHCNVDSCTQGVVSSLEGQVLCREHFISFCFIQIDRYAEMQKGRTVSESDAESMRQFIDECSRQADAIRHLPGDLNNLARSRLLLIVEEVGELGRRLRRSPRTEASVAVRLSCDNFWGLDWSAVEELKS
jgi:NTP pyrophosphatase (non-canonical NTP hydrolase)